METRTIERESSNGAPSPDESGRERLIEAGLRCFSQHGYAATSVALLCREAGVTKPALYWHFDSKEGLLAEVLDRLSERWISRIRSETRAAHGLDPGARLEEMVASFRRLIHEEPHLLRLPLLAGLELGASSQPIRETLLRVWRQSSEALCQDISDAIGLQLPDMDLVADTIISLLQNALVRHSIDADEERLDRNLAELQRVVAGSIGARIMAAQPGGPDTGS